MAGLSSFLARNARSEQWPGPPSAILWLAILSPAILSYAHPVHERSAWYVERTVTGATSATTAASRWVRSQSCSMAAA